MQIIFKILAARGASKIPPQALHKMKLGWRVVNKCRFCFFVCVSPATFKHPFAL